MRGPYQIPVSNLLELPSPQPRTLYLGIAFENVETPEARKEIMTEALAYLRILRSEFSGRG
ncbi:MAG: hypothetical protein ACRDGP_08455, partial [Actinomycetota bacterium]